MKKIFLSIIALVTLSFTSQAQDVYDVIRFSRINPGGSARYVSMGGAFGALGGDLSTLAVNPAGIGVFRASEFSFTPSIYVGSAESTYLGNTLNDSRGSFNIGNVGVVFANEIPDRLNKGGFKFVNFGVSLNRIADFNAKYTMSGKNYGHARADIWWDRAKGYTPEQLQNNFFLDIFPAYETYLINPTHPNDPNNTDYDTFVPDPTLFSGPDAYLRQNYTMETRGSMNEFDFSVGANYNDVLYLGFTLGVPYINYSERSKIEEINENQLPSHPDGPYGFNSYSYELTRDINATGINLKAGVIVKPTKFLRLGFAAHTPTWYPNVQFSQYSTMITDADQGNGFNVASYDSPINEFKFDMRTPYRLMGSAAFLFGNVGLISADYEYVDYTSSKYSASDYNYMDENQALKDVYQAGHNIRLGTEWRVENFSFRGGWGYASSPFKSKDYKNAEAFSYSAGVGYRDQNFYLDFGWSLTTTNDDFMLYSYTSDRISVISDVSKNKLYNNRFLMTVGFRF